MKSIIITNNQLKVITAMYTCGFALYEMTSGATAIAGQDAWLSAILATIMGIPLVWMFTALGALHPDKTSMGIMQLLLGKWFGGVVALSYVFYCFVSVPMYAWYIGNFFTVYYLERTPSQAINILFVIVAVIALLYGLEAIARASEILYYIVFALFVLFTVLLIPNINSTNLFPFLEKGILPVIKGAFLITIASGAQLFMLLMIFPKNISNINEGKKALFKGYFIGMIALSILVVLSVLVLGSGIVSNARYSIFLLSQLINVGIVFSRVEAIMILIWLLTSFIGMLFYFYPVVKGLAQVLGLKNYKTIVLPMGLIVFSLAGNAYKNVPYKLNWDNYVFTPYEITFGLILPLILLLISLVKKNHQR